MASTTTTLLLSLLFLLCSTLNFMPSESHISHNFPISNNHSMTPHETRISQQLHRSFSRMKYLTKLYQTASIQTQTQIQIQTQKLASHADISTKVTYDPESDLYIASYSIGTPPQKVVAFVDTASDLIWTNSKTAFKSASSTTYTVVPCNDKKFCQKLPSNQRTCKGNDPKCTYTLKYTDEASTSGVISQDKFTFDADPGQSSSNIGLLSFGYASDASSEQFEGKDINGCLGLSLIAPFSFITQLGIQKFSHCFIKSSSKSSTMHFGSKAVISAKDSIPLVDNKYYYVNLDGISVGDTKVNIKNPGKIYVDTGATYSLLKKAVYDPFLKLIKEKVAKPAVNPPDPDLGYCFKATKADVDKLPKVTFSFNSNKVNVAFGNDVTYLEFDGGIWCLAILRSSDKESVLGNFQLANLNVGYDIVGKKISFTPTNCALSTTSNVGGLVQAI